MSYGISAAKGDVAFNDKAFDYKGCDLGSDLVDVVKGKVKLKTRCSSDTGKNDARKY
ncbi:hypothetical protein cypCar_00008237, partial [Cyprinus carpio]